MLELLHTEDGSHTIRNIELNETYHSIHGAIQESNHVFITHGLDYVAKSNPKSFKILEVGFGTGLNALLSALDKNSRGIPKIYDAIDAFPLSEELTDQLNYPEYMDDPNAKDLLKSLHSSPWGHSIPITSDFTLKKIKGNIQSVALPKADYDLIYYDAFAPSKQPEVWDRAVLSNVIRAMKNGGILVTYCAKGQFKRDLKSLSMTVESLPGPIGKLEMVRATCHIFK